MGGHPYLSKSTRFFYARTKSIADLGHSCGFPIFLPHLLPSLSEPTNYVTALIL